MVGTAQWSFPKVASRLEHCKPATPGAERYCRSPEPKKSKKKGQVCYCCWSAESQALEYRQAATPSRQNRSTQQRQRQRSTQRQLSSARYRLLPCGCGKHQTGHCFIDGSRFLNEVPLQRTQTRNSSRQRRNTAQEHSSGNTPAAPISNQERRVCVLLVRELRRRQRREEKMPRVIPAFHFAFLGCMATWFLCLLLPRALPFFAAPKNRFFGISFHSFVSTFPAASLDGDTRHSGRGRLDNSS